MKKNLYYYLVVLIKEQKFKNNIQKIQYNKKSYNYTQHIQENKNKNIMYRIF